MSKLAHQPAFPETWTEEYGDHGHTTQYHKPGMTLLQYYAGLAMQRLITPEMLESGYEVKESVACVAGLFADAMIADLERRRP